MFKIKTVALLYLLLYSIVIKADEKPSEINWMTISQAENAMKKQPKKILVDVYTDWCGPCKMMMKNTFTDKEIIDYINSNYYAVKFNAESEASINFKGKTFSNPGFDKTKSGGRNSTHEFTYQIALLNGNIAYPTLVYIDEDFNVLTPVQGYLQPAQLEPILHFFGDNSFKTSSWEDFQKNFKGKIANPNSSEGFVPYKINWMNFTQALGSIQVAPKKIFVDVYTDWCGWCKHMDKTTFTHPVIIELMNKYYYPVKMDAEMKDSLNIGNKWFVNPNPTEKRSTHELAKTLLNNKLSYPTTVYLDETGNILSPVPGYLAPKDMEAVLVFFGENHHKKTTYEEFLKTFKGRIADSGQE